MAVLACVREEHCFSDLQCLVNSCWDCCKFTFQGSLPWKLYAGVVTITAVASTAICSLSLTLGLYYLIGGTPSASYGLDLLLSTILISGGVAFVSAAGLAVSMCHGRFCPSSDFQPARPYSYQGISPLELSLCRI